MEQPNGMIALKSLIDIGHFMRDNSFLYLSLQYVPSKQKFELKLKTRTYP